MCTDERAKRLVCKHIGVHPTVVLDQGADFREGRKRGKDEGGKRRVFR